MSAVVQLTSRSLTALVSEQGAAIRSIQFDGSEVLLQTPWAEDDDRGIVPGNQDEWSARYPGGWHPLVPSASNVEGMPFHGEAAWRRWRTLDSNTALVKLGVMLRTRPLRVLRSVAVAGNELVVEQQATNISQRPTDLTISEHIAWGGELLGPGLCLAVDGVAVELAPWSATSPSSLFASVPTEQGCYRLENPVSGIAIEVSFPADPLCTIVIWQEHRATTGFPWWGLVDAVGVEPSSVDFTKSSVSRPIELEPGETLATSVRLRFETVH